ncbi:MAG: M67 family metallopeptidase [Planctomycetota bacterium]
MTHLEIPINIFERMVAQARTQAPVEACGILAGRHGKVERLYEMTNTDDCQTHYMMKPAEQFAVVKDIRSAGLEMLAIYHSHPGKPARVSSEDVRLALTPDVAYVILSLQEPKHPVIKGFLIENSDVAEVPLEIMGE